MRKIKKSIALILAILLVISPLSSVKAEGEVSLADVENKVEALLVANPDTNEIYYSKNEDKILGIASMSKLMTYLVVKDEIAAGQYKLSDTVKIGATAASYGVPPNSKMDLREGEVLTIENLLAGLMIVSGNDAAVALAINSSGSEKAFVVKMVAKAKELGLTNFTFVNPTGLTEIITKEGKKTPIFNKMSAISLLKLVKHIAVRYPEVENYGKIEVLSMPERNFSGEHTHKMYKTIPGLLGLKTGFTEEAGYNFTGLVDMNKFNPGQKFRLITVVTGADSAGTRNKATKALIQYVDNKYKYMDLINYDRQIPVVDFETNQTKVGSIPLYLEKPIEGIFPRTAYPDLSYKLYKDKVAPFEDGEVLGEVTVVYEGKELGKVNLINKGYKPKLNFFSSIVEYVKDFVKKLMLIF